MRKGRAVPLGAAGALALAAAFAMVPRALPAQAGEAARCVALGAAPVIVTGTIGVAPLGEGSGEPGTAPRHYGLRLLLDAPLCVGVAATGPESIASTGLTELPIVYGERYRFRRIWLGRHVSVTGTMTAAPGDGRSPPAALAALETHILASRAPAGRSRPDDRAPAVDTASR